MNLLDMRTVVVSYVITSALCSLVLLALWRQNRRQPGVALWVVDAAVRTVGLLLIALRGVIPDFWSIVVAQLLLLAALQLMLVGLERYTGRTTSHRYNYVYMALYSVIVAYFALVQPNLQVRNINLSVATTIYYGQYAWLLLRRVDPAMRPEVRGLAAASVAFVPVSIVRILVDLLIHPGADFFAVSWYETGIILTYQMLQTAMTFALVLTVNRRLQTSLRQDVAAREQANTALRASEEKFAKSFRTSPYAITITRAADGKVIDVNDAFVRITGIPRTAAVADTTVNLRVWADVADREHVVEALRAGQPVVGWEASFRRRNGEIFPGAISAQIIQLSDTPHILSSIEDITERKLAEAARERQAQLAQFRAETNEALNGVADLDPALQVCAEAAVRQLGAALARIWLLDPDEGVLTLHASAGLYTHLDGAHGRLVLGATKIGQIAATRQPHLTNTVATDPQIGDPGWARQEQIVAFAGYPLLTAGRLVGVIAMFARQPLSGDTLDALAAVATTIAAGVARRQAEASLAASEAALARKAADLAHSNTDLERFAYVVSHDLQEPLRMVSWFVDRLAQEYRGKLDADADEYIQFAVDGAKRMHRQIQDLLAYSRVETRGEPLRATAATAALNDALWNLDLAITDAQAVITHDPLPVVLADAAQLTQLFQNLLGNALKFRGSDPPAIHIAARLAAGKEGGQAWEFAVADNGIGIEPQYHARVFGVFQRLHTQQAYPGTGIGLAICQRIVERHGGHIWVESQAGHGATFYFTLSPAEPG